jgi:hypothetical protein
MASSLKTLIVSPGGKHTATVIFMHVRCYRTASVSSSNTEVRTGIG